MSLNVLHSHWNRSRRTDWLPKCCFFYQRYFIKQIKQLEAHKGDLMALPIPERLTKLRSLHLTGESLQNFDRWEKQYEQITNHNFSTIEGYLFDAETANAKYQFIQVARILKQLRAYLTETDQDLLDVQDALENLLANEADTRQKKFSVYENNINNYVNVC